MPDTDAVLADAMAEQADVRRLTGTHTSKGVSVILCEVKRNTAPALTRR